VAPLNPNPMTTTPYYEPLGTVNWGGLCSVDMTLACLTVQQPHSFNPPPPTDALLADTQTHNNKTEPSGLWTLDPDAIAWMLNKYDQNDSINTPASSTYCYRTHAFTDQAVADAQLRQAMDDYNMIVCTLRGGGYDWVAVSGYVADATTLYGFWIEDPIPTSAHHYYDTLTYWNSVWTPVTSASPNWGGKYVFVRDDQLGNPAPRLPRGRVGPQHPPALSAATLIDPGQAGQKAIAGARANLLDRYPLYSAAITNGTPGKPLLVHRADLGPSYYYLVPLVAHGADPNGDPAKTPVLGAIAIDGVSGELMTAFASDQPAALFSISLDDARQTLIAQGFPLPDPQLGRVMVPGSTVVLTPLLVHSDIAGSNIFRPFYQAVSGAYVAYVNSATGLVVSTLQRPTKILLGN